MTQKIKQKGYLEVKDRESKQKNKLQEIILTYKKKVKKAQFSDKGVTET